MLTIRKEQMAICAEAMTKSFETRMMAHIRRFFPKRYLSLGESGARETIRCGMSRAAAYAIRGERDLCKYIDLMMVLGQDFDRSPWATSILTDSSKTPDIKVCCLYQETMSGFRP